jgi:hypothetical protein
LPREACGTLWVAFAQQASRDGLVTILPPTRQMPAAAYA